jgi:multidrug efflux system outer membrane protein
MQQARSPAWVPSGLPAKLLERRPDIRQAEQNLRSANAQIGVAMAAFLPTFSLTGRAGKVSNDLASFTSGAATMWSLAANLSGPIFHGGANLAGYRQAKAVWEEARITYEQTAINAFQEVSNALVSREKYEQVRVEQARSVKAFDEAVQVAMMRYKVGMASYYEVLQNEQQLFPAENALAQTDLNRLVSVVQLYRSLGGGWHAGEPVPVIPAGNIPAGPATERPPKQ